jgi:hypothetical protein
VGTKTKKADFLPNEYGQIRIHNLSSVENSSPLRRRPNRLGLPFVKFMIVYGWRSGLEKGFTVIILKEKLGLKKYYTIQK